MAIVIEALTSADGFVVTKPAGTVEGDLLYVHLSNLTTDGTFSAPDGSWTKVGEVSTTDAIQATFYKIAGASEPTSYTFTYSGTSNQPRNGCIRCSGVDQTTPSDTTRSTNNGSGTTATGTSITTATDGALLLLTCRTRQSPTQTAPTGMNHTINVTRWSMFDQIIASAGATGNKDITLSGTNDWTTIMFAARPEGGAPAAPQYARPNADISIGGWTDENDGTTNIYQSIDEVTPSDLDYIKSSVNPISDAVVIGLESKPTPVVDTGHVLRYRYRKEGSGTVNINVALMEGSSVVASWQHDDIGAITTAEQTLTELQAGSITDYSNLRFRVTASEP